MFACVSFFTSQSHSSTPCKVGTGCKSLILQGYIAGISLATHVPMHTTPTKRLNEQAFRVLRRLRGLYSAHNPFVAADWLAADVQMPAASLRRSIYELREAGFSVVHQDKQVGLMFIGGLQPERTLFTGLPESLRHNLLLDIRRAQ